MKQPISSKQRHLVFRRGESSKAKGDPKSNGQADSKPRAPRKYLRDYLNWLSPYRWPLGLLFGFSFVAAVLDLVWPIAIKKVMDLLPLPLEYAVKAHRLAYLGVVIIALLLAKQ